MWFLTSFTWHYVHLKNYWLWKHHTFKEMTPTFVFDWDTVNIRKHHLRDVLKEVVQKYINHLKLRKTSTESIKAILGEIHFIKLCIIIHIFTKMIYCTCICSFSTFFLNTSDWLLPTITVICPLFWKLFNMKNNAFNINLFPMAIRLS